MKVVVRVKRDGAGVDGGQYYANGSGTTPDLQKARIYSEATASYMRDYDWLELLPVDVTVTLKEDGL